MRPLQQMFVPDDYPDLLVGLAEPDDAAVYRIDDQRALIVTTDFFPPVVDDAYDFGAIAAANAMSDVFAMGGKVLFALNLAAFPDNLDLSILSEIMRGGAEKVREAGAAIAGGHSITDKEPKYGLAVVGIAELDQVVAKAGAQVGDVLVLTKALGTGVITTALKQDKVDPTDVAVAVAGMARLNWNAAQAAIRVGAHAMTDITGYSLLGHGHEMAALSQVDLEIDTTGIRWLSGAARYAADWIFPGGMSNNKLYFGQWVSFEKDISEETRSLLFTPETSGGLLIATPPETADQLLEDLAENGDVPQRIGQVVRGEGRVRVV